MLRMSCRRVVLEDIGAAIFDEVGMAMESQKRRALGRSELGRFFWPVLVGNNNLQVAFTIVSPEHLFGEQQLCWPEGAGSYQTPAEISQSGFRFDQEFPPIATVFGRQIGNARVSPSLVA